MNLPPSVLSLLLCACTASLPMVIVRATASAQAQPDTETRSLVARIDAARGNPAKQPATLAIEGILTIELRGARPGREPEVKGTFREIYDGTEHARHSSDMGERGTMESGITAEVAWELFPYSRGAKVYSGTQALTVRRYFALLRGARPAELYKEFARTGMQKLDGREHVVLRMTPAEGKPDTWYVDPESATVSRIDMVFPAPESTDASFRLGDTMQMQLTFGEWKKVDGVLHPHRRTLTKGPMMTISTFTFTKIESGATLGPSSFTPPEQVLEIQSKSKPATHYEIIELKLQRVASIRVKCKPEEVIGMCAALRLELMCHLNATSAEYTGEVFTRYHSFGENEVDLEVGCPVAKPITEKSRVKNGELPAGKTVMAWHTGAFEELFDARKALEAHVHAKELKPRGGPWEVYSTASQWHLERSKHRTQLFMPIKK